MINVFFKNSINMLKKLYRIIFIILTCVKVKTIRRKKRIIFILGTPVHNNIGDLAITLAEVEFIKKIVNTEPVILIPLWVMEGGIKFLEKIIRTYDLIIGHGGGNIGDLYIIEEQCRRNFISSFPNNKIIIFPQTIHFSESTNGRIELSKTKLVYSKHSNLNLIAREKVSYKIMKEQFPNNNVIISPDIVLSLNLKNRYQFSRKNALSCLRNDIESKLNIKDKESLLKWLSSTYAKNIQTDTISKNKFFRLIPKNTIVMSKIKEFAKSEFVLTDRLHGMVIAAITGTPCIALSNTNHKVMGTYEWIKDLDYIKFCANSNKLDQTFAGIRIHEKHTYDPEIFDKYWKNIKDLVVYI